MCNKNRPNPLNIFQDDIHHAHCFEYFIEAFKFWIRQAEDNLEAREIFSSSQNYQGAGDLYFEIEGIKSEIIGLNTGLSRLLLLQNNDENIRGEASGA